MSPRMAELVQIAGVAAAARVDDGPSACWVPHAELESYGLGRLTLFGAFTTIRDSLWI